MCNVLCVMFCKSFQSFSPFSFCHYVVVLLLITFLVSSNISCNKGNMTGTTYGTGTAQPFGTPVFCPDFKWGSRCSIFNFMYSALQIIVCPFFLFCCSFYCLTFFDLRLHRQTFLVFIYDLPDKMMFMSIDTDETRNICKFVAPEFTLSFCGVSVVKSLVVCGGCLHHYLSYCLFFELRFPFIPLVSSSFP